MTFLDKTVDTFREAYGINGSPLALWFALLAQGISLDLVEMEKRIMQRIEGNNEQTT